MPIFLSECKDDFVVLELGISHLFPINFNGTLKRVLKRLPTHRTSTDKL